jgi:hypothetical protein
MFRRVHNYDLKKKMYSPLAFGRNDNYDLKIKRIQLFGGCIITFGKKNSSVVWPSLEMVGGVIRAQMFWRFIFTI